MIFQIFNRDILKILTVFSLSPGSRFSRDDLKKKTLMNNVPLDNALNTLINSKIIRKNKRLLQLDLKEENVKKIIRLVISEYKALKEIPLSVYFSILELIYHLSKHKNIKVYLFGSYSKLIFNNKSDIDIAIILSSLDKKNINNLVRRIEKTYKKRIEIHYFSRKFEKQTGDPLVKEIFKNGERLI